MQGKLFSIAICLFAIYNTIHYSELNSIEGLMKVVKYSSYSIIVALSVFKIASIRKYDPGSFILSIMLFFITLYLYILNGNYLLASVALVILSYGVDFNEICKKVIKVNLISILFLFLLTSLGVLKDNFVFRDDPFFGKGVAHALGYIYYSGFSYNAMGIILCTLYLFRRNITIFRVVFILLLSCFVFYLSYTRLQIIVCVIFTLIFFLLRYLRVNNISKFMMLLGVILYPSVCFLSYYISTDSFLSSTFAFYDMANEALSSRLDLNEKAFRYFEIKPWGQVIENVNTIDEYFYIDSGYVDYLLRNGYVFTSLISICYSLIFIKVYRNRNMYTYVWLMIFGLVSFANGFLITPLSNPIIFLLFAKSDEDDYNIPQIEYVS